MRPPIPCEISPPNIYWRESQGDTQLSVLGGGATQLSVLGGGAPATGVWINISRHGVCIYPKSMLSQIDTCVIGKVL